MAGALSVPGAGLEVVDNRGAVAVNGGTIARTAGTGLEVRGGADNGSLVVRAAVSEGSGRAVHVRCEVSSPDCGAGAVLVAGPVSSTTGGVAVVDNRDGSTVVFSGGLDLSTGALPAFVATDSSSLEVSGSANVLGTTTGRRSSLPPAASTTSAQAAVLRTANPHRRRRCQAGGG